MLSDCGDADFCDGGLGGVCVAACVVNIDPFGGEAPAGRAAAAAAAITDCVSTFELSMDAGLSVRKEVSSILVTILLRGYP